MTATVVAPAGPARVAGRAIAAIGALLLTLTACSTGGTATTPAPDDTWRTAALLDARTGETYTIGGLRGKLVAVEPMAIWCTTCQLQQFEAAEALADLETSDLIYISLDIEPNEEPAALAAYATERGFDWVFSVSGAAVARSLAATFGDQVLSPPSTPLILIGPDGRVIAQDFGIRGADDLIELFSSHLP